MRWVVFSWGLLELLSCRREIPLPRPEEGSSLFPLQTGYTWVYEVRETTYTTSGPVPARYFLRMRIDTPTTDAYRRPCFYVLWDTCSLSDSGNWGFYRAGLAYRDTSQAELWENNKRLLMLRFPISPALQWNRYEYTNLPPENCRYLVLDTTYTIEAKTFPHSAFVLRRCDTLSLLRRAFFYEVYCRGVGLVHLKERLDAFDLGADGSITRNTDTYYREYLLRSP
ncbi:MAG: hypothetical protein N2170_02050 [Bacteroidia bacterium]|nr:hypothetical protein [Bacteroidia bacterium]